MGKVRLGFIGAGWWATTNHMPILKRRDDVEFVGVASLGKAELAKVREKFGFGMVTENVEELLAQDLDGVVISSPHDFHAEHAIAALNAGAHALVEKPFTLSSKEAWAVVDLAEKTGRHVLVPYGWNYMPFLERAKEIMDTNPVGPIEYVLCHMASPNRGLFAGSGSSFDGWEPSVSDANLSTWQDPARGGGYAHGQITHSAGLMFMLTGLRVSRVHGALLSAPNAKVDLFDSASVVFDNGAIGTISGAAGLPDNDPFQLDIRIFGPEGAMMIDIERERVELRRHDGQHISVPVAAGAGAYHCNVPPNRFVDLIQGKGRNNSDGRLAAKTVELLEAMHKAHKTGAPAETHGGRA